MATETKCRAKVKAEMILAVRQICPVLPVSIIKCVFIRQHVKIICFGCNLSGCFMNCSYDMILKVTHWNPYETDVIVEAVFQVKTIV